MEKGAAYWMDLRYFDDEDSLFLAQVQRGITNFVKILTGKDIPVQYATSGDSMTDGKTVYIASNIKKDTLDSTVGLALHEASHVLLTDFEYLNKEKGTVLKKVHGVPEEDHDNVFTLINFIEDKRIDNYIYKTAPGYQFYYEELYRKYFFNKIIDIKLQTDNFTTPTWNAYFFRIINIFNRNSDLTKLPGLNSVEVAVNIYKVIKQYLIEEVDNKIEGPSQVESSRDESKIQDQVDRQKNFIDSKYRKKRVHKKIRDQINNMAESDIKLKYSDVDKDISIPVMVCNDWDKTKYFKANHQHFSVRERQDSVEKGILMGKKLLSKLKVRNSIRKDIFENQKKGKLDTRKLYQASFNENIFYKVEKEDYKNIFIHISLDLSGSMNGEKLEKTIQTAIAIAYAACHLKNFDVEISLRGTENPIGAGKQDAPLLAYAFNSKKHSYKKLYKFKNISTWGLTPEGICLEQVRKNLPQPSYNQEVYLLNISDGLPNINHADYKFSTAVNHTAKVMRQYKKANIGILSYYVQSVWERTQSQDSKGAFYKMYGKDAQFIDIDNISLVAKTINDLLLSNTIKVS